MFEPSLFRTFRKGKSCFSFLFHLKYSLSGFFQDSIVIFLTKNCFSDIIICEILNNTLKSKNPGVIFPRKNREEKTFRNRRKRKKTSPEGNQKQSGNNQDDIRQPQQEHREKSKQGPCPCLAGKVTRLLVSSGIPVRIHLCRIDNAYDAERHAAEYGYKDGQQQVSRRSRPLCSGIILLYNRIHGLVATAACAES